MFIKDKIYRMREGKVNREYADRLRLLHRPVSYEKWLKDQRFQPMDLSEEKWSLPDAVILMNGSGTVPEENFEKMAELFASRKGIRILYGDETRQSAYRSFPAWSPDSFLAGAQLCSLYVIRRSLWEKAADKAQSVSGLTRIHGSLYHFEKAEDIRPLLTELLTMAGGFEACAGTDGRDAIVHLPMVLWNAGDGAWEDSGSAMTREQLQEKVDLTARKTGLSVIIPSKDNPKVLKQCLDALQKAMQQENFGILGQDCEIIIVDNGSSDAHKAEIETFTENMQYLYELMPFNFSHMCNMGARAAKGQVLLFLNDDVEICENGALTALYEKALKPYTGAAGLKLYYPDSSKIQHAGIQNLPGGPVHKLQFTNEEENDSVQSARNGNVLAVTGACLMVTKEKFLEAGGFPESLQVAYNDVDLCLSLYEKGYYNVVIRDRYAYHHESLSRGNDLTPAKLKRLIAEREELYERHPEYRGEDPFYPKPLCRELGDTHIYPAFWDNDETWQTFRFAPMQKLFGRENKEIVLEISVKPGQSVEGYTYLPGENNAIYQHFLALRKEGVDLKKEKFPYYAVILGERYCAETTLEHPECLNVALCGFKARLEGVPAGTYRPGVMYRSRIGRRSYCYFSELRLEIGEDGSARLMESRKPVSEQAECGETEQTLQES